MRSTPLQTTKAMMQRRAVDLGYLCQTPWVLDAVPVSHRSRALREVRISADGNAVARSHTRPPCCTCFTWSMIDCGGCPNAYLQAELDRKRMGEQAASLQVRRMLP